MIGAVQINAGVAGMRSKEKPAVLAIDAYLTRKITAKNNCNNPIQFRRQWLRQRKNRSRGAA